MNAPAPAVFRRSVTLEQLNALSARTAMASLGIVFTEIGPDYLRGTMPVDARTHQPYGLLHGGASVVLAETLGSVAAALNAPPGRVAVGVDINATHHRAATAGVVTGVATPVHVGRSMASFEIAITDESGRRTCTARITCALLDQVPAPKA